MRRLTAYLLALVLGGAAALALVSCGSGGGNAKLLPGDTARQITANLDTVKQLASSGDCAGAQSEAQQVSAQIDALGGVDKQLKQALREGAARLNQVVARCSATTTTATAPTTAPTTTESTKGQSKPKKEKKPKKNGTTPAVPTTTTPTLPTNPTQTTPTTPTSPTTPSPPGGGGGTGAPPGGGIGPGNAGGGN